FSFESRTDWTIGEMTDGNCVELTEGDSAEFLQVGTKVGVGSGTDSNNNMLTVSGSTTALHAQIGALGNSGSAIKINSTGVLDVDSITLHENNSLKIEGELTSFDMLAMAVQGAEITAVIGGVAEVVDATNFKDLLQPNFNIATGYTEYSPFGLLLGDVNLDGFINLLDVEPFVGLLSDGQFQAEADINQDGLVNLLDIEGFVALLSAG
ncbi:MAG: dockerin type I domain-containing protein, partial [Planctomycetota bacterium]